MTPERWEKITEIYAAALELEESERSAYLKEACGSDEDLRREVESLIAADQKAGSFIAENAVKDSPSLLTIKNFPTLTGKILGHYRIISQIGTGGMGEVYLAKDTRLNRSVALKALPFNFSANPKYLQRFRTEAKAAATLNHPNIATVYSVEENNGQPFITMEYVEGTTLDAQIPKDGIDLDIFFEWFVALADAFAHAHEKGIIHRDIKPGNVIITPANTPKILDFGLAQIDRTKTCHEDPTLDLTQPGQILGTPAYMSPEQAEGGQIDQRSDIFSFGVVMYEAITAEKPFKGDSYASVINAVLSKEPQPIVEVKPETPFLLARLITKCLNKDRRKRFQTMGEVCAILEEIKAAVEAGISMDSSSAPRLLSLSKSYSRGWIFAPLILVILLGMSLVIYYSALDDSVKPPISFENVTLRKLSQTNNVVYAQITPDGKSVAFNTIEDDGKRALWIRRVEDKNALQLLLPQPVFFWGGLTVSRDGSQIYYITAERSGTHGTLYRISSLGGTPRRLVETVNDLGSLSPDGERILYVRYGKDMERQQIISANASDGSNEQVIYELGKNYIFRDPQFSLDGKSVFFIKFERIDGEEYWSLVQIPATDASKQEKVIIPLRKPRLSELIVLKDGSGLLVNAVDPVSNLSQLFHISLTEAKETRITNDLNTYFGISISDDGKTIVTTQRETLRDIWTVSGTDTDTFRKLTNEPNVYSSAVWTPDGRIVFDALDNNRPHIWIMHADGTNIQQLTPNDSFDYEPRVSPDGRFIVFTSKRSGETKIWRMNIDGRNPQILMTTTGTAFGPVITPDSKWVFFHWNKDSGRVWGRVPLNGGAAAEQPFPNPNQLAVSPDGKQIAYAFYDDQDRRYKVRVRPMEAKEPSMVFNITPINFLLWSADGKGLLYREIESSAESDSTVMLKPVSGGEPKPFLSVKPDDVFNVCQTSDGKQMAVVRGKHVTDAVMLMKIELNSEEEQK